MQTHELGLGQTQQRRAEGQTGPGYACPVERAVKLHTPPDNKRRQATFKTDRGTAKMAVIGCELLTYGSWIQKALDLARHVVGLRLRIKIVNNRADPADGPSLPP